MIDKKDSDVTFFRTLENLTDVKSEVLVKKIDVILREFSTEAIVHPSCVSLMLITNWIERINRVHTKDMAMDVLAKLVKVSVDNPAEFLDRFIPLVEEDLVNAGRVQVIKGSKEVTH